MIRMVWSSWPQEDKDVLKIDLLLEHLCKKMAALFLLLLMTLKLNAKWRS